MFTTSPETGAAYTRRELNAEESRDLAAAGSTLDQKFVCACCGQRDAVDVGSYALPVPAADAGGSTTLSYPLAQCCVCGHVQAHPPPSSAYLDQYYSKQFWSTHGVDDELGDHDWFESLTGKPGARERYERARRQAEYLAHAVRLPADAKIIDLGSGTAPFLFCCRELGYRNLYALEPSEAICSYLERQGIVTYPMLLEEFVTRDDLPSFDAMVISHTVEHLVDPRSVLTGLRARLESGGSLYVDVPYRDDRFPYHEGLHLQFFGPESMERVLQRSGFSVAACEVDRLTWRDRAVLKIMYPAYRRIYGSRGGLGAGSRTIERLYRFVWRPFTKLLRLNIKIFISHQDLRVVARVATGSAHVEG